jgi:hypothetical protein
MRLHIKFHSYPSFQSWKGLVLAIIQKNGVVATYFVKLRFQLKNFYQNSLTKALSGFVQLTVAYYPRYINLHSLCIGLQLFENLQ